MLFIVPSIVVMQGRLERDGEGRILKREWRYEGELG